MRRRRDNAARLRTAVDLLPRHTREGMLHGIDSNSIIVGGYTDGEGGVCPMLAAHRNGGRTSFASFARAWDAFTGAGKRPRRASGREVRVLRTHLEMSLLDDDTRIGTDVSLTAIAKQIRAERNEIAERGDAPERSRPGDRNRARELRHRSRWSWLRPARRYDVYQATLAAASEQISEQRVDELLSDSERETTPAHR
ncbi:MAG TPA: hypothetical protein VIL53_10330 [Solirubrobacterales bacterium]